MPVLAWLDSTLYDALPYCVITLSLVLTFKYLRFPDVTVSASFVLGAAVSAIAVVYWHLPGPLAVCLGAVAGALGGLVTAVIHVWLKVEPIVASILSAFAIYAVNQTLLRPTVPYGSASTILSLPERIDRSVNLDRLPWHPASILFFAIVVVVVKLTLDWLLSSEAGLALRSLEDPEAGESVLARLGVRPGAIKAMGLGVGNGLVGLSGALISMKEGSANLHRGLDILITGLIAYLLGQALVPIRHQCARVRPTMTAIGGAIAYFGLVDLSYRVGVPTELTRMVLALLVAITVGRVQWSRQLKPVPVASSASADRREENAVIGLSYAYPSSDLPVLCDVTAHFKLGRVTQLRGGNGTGKTTLCRLIAGQLGPARSGRIVVAGEDVTHSPESRLASVRYIDQNASRSVVKTISVIDYLSLCMLTKRPSPFRRAVTPARLQSIRSTFAEHGFHPDVLAKHASALSGGQTQLVNVIGFLVEHRSPPLILLDEPLNGLDRSNREKMIDLVRLLRSTGAAVVVVSHDPEGLGVDHIVDLESGSPQMTSA